MASKHRSKALETALARLGPDLARKDRRQFMEAAGLDYDDWRDYKALWRFIRKHQLYQLSKEERGKSRRLPGLGHESGVAGVTVFLGRPHLSGRRSALASALRLSYAAFVATEMRRR